MNKHETEWYVDILHAGTRVVLEQHHLPEAVTTDNTRRDHNVGNLANSPCVDTSAGWFILQLHEKLHITLLSRDWLL